ncbi:DMT family transporter [Arthrobacter sp. LAPM80]|uniref:DMT family transporter n=1 Tax=Arthrobacter sp. LAPM80 TaxID=3141788 RepID=UPI00398B7E1C
MEAFEVQAKKPESQSHGYARKVRSKPFTVTIGVGFVLLSALAFGSTPAFVRLAYTAQINGLSLVVFRCLIAAAVLWLVARLVREKAAPWGNAWRLILVGAFLFGPQMWAYFAALGRLDTSITVAVVYVYPALVAILVALQARKVPQGAEIGLLVLGLCGVGTIVLANPVGTGSAAGLVLAAVTAVGYALYVFSAGTVVGDTPPLAAASLVLLGAGSSSVVAALVTGQLEFPQTVVGAGYLALHGVVIVPIGLAAYYAGLKRLGATFTSLTDTSQPAIAALIGVLALSERLLPVQILGMVAIVVAVLGLPVMAVCQSRKNPNVPEPVDVF